MREYAGFGSGIYIAGAHSRARTFKEYVTALYPETRVAAFLVSGDETGAGYAGRVTDGVPVKITGREAGLDPEIPVYIATRGVFHEKITRELKSAGMKYIYPVNVEMDTYLRNEYVSRAFGRSGKKFELTDGVCREQKTAAVYVASSVRDAKPAQDYTFLPQERVIQAGAALTAERLAGAVPDNTGDNISALNAQFCELTALYWIWKNAAEDIVGLVHYRRHFLLSAGWMDCFEKGGADVILPVPLYAAPSIEGNYRGRHTQKHWDDMMELLREIHPDDYCAAGKFFRETALYSPCNMLIAKKEVLDSLCVWLFPVLFAAAGRGGTESDGYQNRYPGFLSERLITFFFEKNSEKYHVMYADKNFLK